MKDKEKMLRESGTFNFASGKIRNELFEGNEFFDSSDLLQVKYEMLRAVIIENCTVAQSCAKFGLSRTAFYHAQEEFAQAGLSGMLPAKRGPRGPHKLKGEHLEFIKKLREKYPEKKAMELAKLAETQTGIKVHPRTVSRALKKLEIKKGRYMKEYEIT